MKILHFIYGLHVGGAETFIKNLLTSLQKYPEYEFYFVVQDSEITNEFFRNLQQSYKNKFFFISSVTKSPLRHYFSFKNLLKSNSFNVVHVHMNSFVNPLPIIVCHSLHIPVVIHSHNTKNAAGGILGTFLHKLNRRLFNHNSDIRLACSREAGRWMFRSKEFDLIWNSIDVKKFKYNREDKIKIRTQFGINIETNVIGIVGRLHPQKNHKKAILVFKSLLGMYPDATLLIVGDGPLKEELINFTKNLNISEKVVFTGEFSDVAPYYSAIDILLMPSIHEGLSIVGIEAQASGLKIIASDVIPQEMKISELVKYISLDLPDSRWAERINTEINNNSEEKRLLINDRIYSSKFSLPYLASSMDKVYTNIKKNIIKSL